MTEPRRTSGRLSAQFATTLRSRIEDGTLASGVFLPTERELAAQNELARVTVRRALQLLESEGLVAIEPRHGYRVLTKADEPGKACPLGYVLHSQSADVIQNLWQMVLSSSVAQRGGSLLLVPIENQSRQNILDRIRAARVWGLILDTYDSNMHELLKATGLPSVMLNCWSEHAQGLDAVLQNNHQGGYLAAERLLAQGHKEIGWFGPVAASIHSRERFTGALAAVLHAGLGLSCLRPVPVPWQNPEQTAHMLLSRPDYPRAILALWPAHAVALGQAAYAHNLKLGRDLDIIGCTTDEHYPRYSASFPGGLVPPTVLHCATLMARTAIERLADRLADPTLAPVRISVPSRLEEARTTAAVSNNFSESGLGS